MVKTGKKYLTEIGIENIWILFFYDERKFFQRHIYF